MHFFYLALIGGIFIFSLIVILLNLFGKDRRYLNTLLSLGIGGVIWYIVMYLLTNTGYIRHFPDLFNKGLPFYYLIGPCFYLYMRGTIYQKYATFRKKDLLHLIVAFPAVCSILPYCLLDDPSQQFVVDQIAKDQNYSFSGAAYIVGVWHWFAWPLTALIYTIIQFYLIKDASNTISLIKNNAKWMYRVTVMCGLIFATLLTVNTAVLFDRSAASIILGSSNMVLFLCWCLLILGGIFFSNPAFIYGGTALVGENVTHFEFVGGQQSKDELYREKETHTSAGDLNLIASLENFLTQSKLYLEAGLTLSRLSVEVGIPSYKLSDLLNNHYQKNFNAYINAWRVKHVIQRLEDGDHKSLTLEALANDAGFISRNSFFTAFKKEMGLSPSSYISSLKLPSA